MGIKNLFPFLKQYGKDTNLADFAGKTAAIDASCWIHRALAISVSGCGNRDRLESIFRKHLNLVKSAGVTPFIVFDGSPLPAKANEAAKRQKTREEALRRANDVATQPDECNKLRSQGIAISFQDISTCIDICLKDNIRYIVSPYEADAQIAFILKRGLADFAITEDSDLLAYGCKEIFVKVKLSGDGNHFVLENILDSLKLTLEQFRRMCIAAGCDYLDNIKGVGIHTSYALVSGNHLFENLTQRGAPKDYKEQFFKAEAVFNHQTVFDINTIKCVPLNEWGKQFSDELQYFCGILLEDTFSVNLASGNVDPKSGVKVNSYPVLRQVPVNNTNADDHQETSSKTNENERLEVSIINIDPTPFLYRIPSFPVLTVKLKKVRFIRGGKEYKGLIKDEGPLNISTCGHYVCTSSCSITIDNESYLVLWELCRSSAVKVSTGNLPDGSGNDATVSAEIQGPHSLPFKVLGSCYDMSRQRALEEAYEYLYDFNRPVFVKLEAQPENSHDKNAIGVYIMTNYEYILAGYIASELTKYLHPLLGTSELDVSVKRIRFCTTYLRMGFYLTVEITKNGLWDEGVVNASKKVA